MTDAAAADDGDGDDDDDDDDDDDNDDVHDVSLLLLGEHCLLRDCPDVDESLPEDDKDPLGSTPSKTQGVGIFFFN